MSKFLTVNSPILIGPYPRPANISPVTRPRRIQAQSKFPVKFNHYRHWNTVKHYLLCILILRFSYVENSLLFNSADFYYQNSYRIIVYILQRIWHIAWQNCWYSMQINLRWWAVPKICVYLISRFHLNCENLMLTKYTCCTVFNNNIYLSQRLAAGPNGSCQGCHWLSIPLAIHNATDCATLCGKNYTCLVDYVITVMTVRSENWIESRACQPGGLAS